MAKRQRRASPAFVGREAYTTKSLALFLALKQFFGLWAAAFGSTGNGQTPEAGFARLCRPEAYTTKSLAIFLALKQRCVVYGEGLKKTRRNSPLLNFRSARGGLCSPL